MAATQGLRPASMRQRRADLALLAVAAAWGATFVMVKEALDHIGPLTFVACRFGLAALALLPFVARPSVARPFASHLVIADGRRGTEVSGSGASRRRLRRGVVPAGALVGAFLFAGYALQTAGLQFTSAGRAGFITGLNVVIVPLLAATLGRQAVGPLVALGVGLATAGLGLLSLPDLTGGPLEVNAGDLLVLGCAFAFALHILSVDRFAPSHDVLALTFVQVAAVALLAAVAALIWERPTLVGLAATWPAIAFTGLVCTVVAFSIQVQAQRFTSPTRTALVFSTEPVFAAVFAVALGGERLGLAEAGGCAFILLGMIVALLAPTERDEAV